MRSILVLIAATFMLSLADAARGASTVREFSGNATITTAEFAVDGPWLLDWHLNGDYGRLVALDIALIDAKTGKHLGRVLHTKRIGNGLKLFKEGGVYRLRVSATFARWRIKIEQITPEEVELYTPRKQEKKTF